MKQLLSILFVLCLFTLSVMAEKGPWVKVVSEDTGEPLPFSVIELVNGWFITTDTNGIANISHFRILPDTIAITSFNHDKKKLTLNGINPLDTITIKLSPSFVSLNEVTARPFLKYKDITIGKKKSLVNEFCGIRIVPNPSYNPNDTASNNERWVNLGVKITAPKNTLNVLKAFGVNVVPTENTPKNFIFKLIIYDVSGKKPKDPKDIPTPVCEPLYVVMDRDSITEQGFRYELPQPIDLPEKAVIIVKYAQFNPLKEGEAIDLVETLSGKGFFYGNPYYESSHTIFKIRVSLSPFFWEYTQYSLPKEK
ncbi:MAG: carboxypeptidase-like regulatory domain-containing protein [Bacteroides sp.]|nr:carboxypeptidase-like regulatory domain-containing protein [Bacteroides sp.]